MLALFPGITEGRSGGEFFCPGIERRVSDLLILGPMRQQAPLHHLRNALAVLRTDGNEHRGCGRLVPVALEVRSRRDGIERQLDLDFGVIRGQSNATTHEPYVGSLGPFPTSPVAASPSLVRIEFLATEPLLEFIGVSFLGEAVNVEPLAVVVDSVTSAAERHALTELMNFLVATAFTEARGQNDLIWPAAVNGGWR